MKFIILDYDYHPKYYDIVRLSWLSLWFSIIWKKMCSPVLPTRSTWYSKQKTAWLDDVTSFKSHSSNIFILRNWVFKKLFLCFNTMASTVLVPALPCLNSVQSKKRLWASKNGAFLCLLFRMTCCKWIVPHKVVSPLRKLSLFFILFHVCVYFTICSGWPSGPIVVFLRHHRRQLKYTWPKCSYLFRHNCSDSQT